MAPRAILAAVALLLAFEVAAAPKATVARGDSAPNFALPKPGGRVVELAALRGRVVVVYFWADWCWPCKRELPELQVLAKKLRDARKPVVFLAVSQDEDPRIAHAAAAALGALDICFLHDEQGQVARRYGVEDLPSTFIVDKKGRLSAVQRSYIPGQVREHARAIRELLR